MASNSSWIIPTVVTVVVLIVTLWSFTSAKSLERKERQYGCERPLRYPQRERILGLDFSREFQEAVKAGTSLQLTEDRFKRCNRKTFTAGSMGRNVLYTMDPRNAQAIISTQFDSFGVEPSRSITSQAWMGKGILTADGEVWRQSRDALKPIFQRAQSSDLDRFASHVERLFDFVPVNGAMVDLQPLFYRLYLDHSTDLLFGESVNSLGPGSPRIDADAFIKTFDEALRGVARRLGRGKFVHLVPDGQFTKSASDSQRVVDDYIKSAASKLKSPEPKEANGVTFVGDLVQQTNDLFFVRSNLLGLFYVARETAATGISNMFFLLARHPEVWDKVRQEVKEQLGAKDLTRENLKTLKYTNQVIMESLRLHAPGSRINRTALKDCVMPSGGGESGESPIFIREGTYISLETAAMHRDPDIWGSDAHLFRPERWTERERAFSWEYIPWLGGPRHCFGQPLVTIQYMYLLVQFSRRFEHIGNRDYVDEFIEETRMAKTSRNGVKVAFS